MHAKRGGTICTASAVVGAFVGFVWLHWIGATLSLCVALALATFEVPFIYKFVEVWKSSVDTRVVLLGLNCRPEFSPARKSPSTVMPLVHANDRARCTETHWCGDVCSEDGSGRCKWFVVCRPCAHPNVLRFCSHLLCRNWRYIITLHVVVGWSERYFCPMPPPKVRDKCYSTGHMLLVSSRYRSFTMIYLLLNSCTPTT